jgi:hypothetical protein
MAAKTFALPALVLALLLSSAGFASAHVWRGNDTGGIIPWSVENERLAPESASSHCAGWGKYARITDGIREPGYFINFICAHNYGQRYYAPPQHFWPRQPRS